MVKVRDENPELWQRSLDLENTYFDKWPNRYKGLRDDGLRLTDPLKAFNQTSCDSGGCFI